MYNTTRFFFPHGREDEALYCTFKEFPTIEKILIDTELINDKTEVWIRDCDMRILAHGNRYQDNVVKYTHYEIESLTWQDDNKIYIDIKQSILAAG